MTNKEAVEILNQQKYPYPEHYKDIEVNEALDLAIRAMEALESIDFNIYALGKLMEEYKNEIN